jgi:TorA maturation chaperone TorD
VHNDHIALYYRFMCWLAEQQKRPMAQFHYYTLAMLEEDPEWKPDHLR